MPTTTSKINHDKLAMDFSQAARSISETGRSLVMSSLEVLKDNDSQNSSFYKDLEKVWSTFDSINTQLTSIEGKYQSQHTHS